MREIKFRGRNGNMWVYGNLHIRKHEKYGDSAFIIGSTEKPATMQVDVQTVGQFTGVHDVNGKEIFEGDILKFTDDGLLCYVDWHKHLRKFYLSFGEKQKENDTKSDIFEMMRMGYKFAIVGNIHDNPELLKRI